MTSTSAGPNYTPDNQISFIIQWFRTWSELQKDDFVEILAQKLSSRTNVNGLVNGMQKLDTDSKRVSLFSCQIKLFNEWWGTWSENDKENLTSRLKDSDPKFWTTVQEEMDGTRKKVEDDFFFTVNNCMSNGSSSAATVHNNDATSVTNGNHSEDTQEDVGVPSNNQEDVSNGDQQLEEMNDDVDTQVHSG